jgi:gliding motility-associated lipoprotein GldD
MQPLCLFFKTGIILLFLSLLVSSCDDNYLPKPKGYYRISFPEKKYKEYTSTCPYSFEYPEYAQITPDSSRRTQACWINLDFPRFNGRLHISYKSITNDFNSLAEDSRTLAYKHTVKAEAINERRIEGKNKVYGVYYDIEGNTASAIQFVLTDSTKHFLRGALYFYNKPNIDSLSPVVQFIQKDIEHLINTFQWK